MLNKVTCWVNKIINKVSSWLLAIKLYINFLRSSFDLFIKKFPFLWNILVFLRKKQEWALSSWYNYAVVLFGGSIWLAFVRYFQIWSTNSWELIHWYYSGVAFSFFAAFFMILVKYFREKGYFRRSELNSHKRDRYLRIVSDAHDIKLNLLFAKSWIVLMILYNLHIWVYERYPTFIGQKVTLFIILILLVLYIINHFYISRCIKKTAKPVELLREPPKWFEKLCSTKYVNTILLRKYSTIPKSKRSWFFYEANRESFAKIGLGLGGVITTSFAAENFYSIATGDVGPLAKAYTKTCLGWYTHNPHIKKYAHELERWGFDLSTLKYVNSSELDGELVKETYKRIKNEKYPNVNLEELNSLKLKFLELQENSEIMKQRLKTLENVEPTLVTTEKCVGQENLQKESAVK